jgi:hypothetical protein
MPIGRRPQNTLVDLNKDVVQTTTRQIGTIYDLIAAGEIEGLVGQASGVYLNDTPMLAFSQNKVHRAKSKANSTISATNTITKINITNQGTNYTSTPTISFSGGGGSDAAATAIMQETSTNNEVKSITITNAGSGYTSVPTISFSGGGGSDAAATAERGGTITNAGTLFKNVDLSTGSRYVAIKGAGPSTTIATASSAKYIDTITVDYFGGSPAFETKHTRNFLGEETAYNNDYVRYVLRIPGKGPEGLTEYQGNITGIVNDDSTSTQTLTLQPAIVGVAITTTDQVTIDDVKKLTAITSTSAATMESAVWKAGSFTSTVFLNSTTTIVEEVGPQNFEMASYALRKGSRYQSEYSENENAPSASFIFADNTELKWHAEGGHANATAGTHYVNSTGKAFGQNVAAEIDRIKLNIEFPGGLRHVTDMGNDINAYVEFQIVFEHQQSGDSEWQRELIFGYNYGQDGAELFGNNARPWTIGKKLFARDEVYGIKANDNPSTQRTNLNGGLVTRHNISSSFISQFNLSVKKFQPFDNWKIGIKRMSPDSGSDYTASNNQFSGMARLKTVECHILDTLSYPTSAYSVVTFSAEDFQSPPKRGYHIRGKLVKVPTNYFTREELNTTASGYNRNVSSGNTEIKYQSWNGSFRGDQALAKDHVNFKKVYTNNPAWIFYDILTDKDFGLGEFIEETDIDKYGLYQIARYCDELVPNGKGGQEPRFSCNVYLASRQEAYKVLKDLASIFRSMLAWIDGQITLVQDSPKEAIYTFTQGNVLDGMFEYTYTGQRARINQVNVTWNNPDEMYKKTVVSIEDTANVIKQGKTVQKDLVAFGCTSGGQAERLGLWHLATDTQETEVVSFSTGINASFMRPGDIINVQDHNAFSIEQSGRLSSTGTQSTTSIILDRSVVLPSGTNVLYLIYSNPGIYLAQESATINSIAYTRGALLLEDDDGTAISTQTDAVNLVDGSNNAVITQFSEHTRVEIKDISTTGTASTIAISGAFSAAPSSDVVWAIGAKDTTDNNDVNQFRIMSIEEEDTGYQLTASKYVIDKFDEIEYDKPLFTTKYIPSSTRGGDIPDPTNINVEIIPYSIDTKSNVTNLTKLVISWTPPVENFTDDAGITTEIPYRFVKSYLVTINPGVGSDESTGYQKNTHSAEPALEIKGYSAGTYTVRVNTVNDLGSSSPGAEVTRNLNLLPVTNRVEKIARGGQLSSLMSLSSSTLSFNTTPFSFIAPSNIDYTLSGTQEQDFNGLSSGETGYLYFDAITSVSSVDITSGGSGISSATVVFSAPTSGTTATGTAVIADGVVTGVTITDAGSGYFSAPTVTITPNTSTVAGTVVMLPYWKNMVVHTDATVKDTGGKTMDVTYLKEVDAVTNGLVTVGGSSPTVFIITGRTTLTGVNTTFTTDFNPGDMVKVSSSSAVGTEVDTSEYREVVAINNDYSLVVRSAFTRSASSWYAFKQAFKPDIEADAILAKVARSESDYTLTTFTTYIGSDTGISGLPGLNTATAYLYQVSTSNSTAPDDPDGDLTYTFSDATISGSNFNGWSATRPVTSNTNPYRWVIAGPASATTATDIITSGDWAGAVLDSAEGFQSATVWLYKRSTSATLLDEPDNDLTWNFANGALTVADGHAAKDGWTEIIPDTGGSYIHVITAVALAVNSASTDVIVTGDWSDPAVLAPPGDTGAGTNFVFKRAAGSAPDTPTANGLNLPTPNWLDDPPTTPLVTLWSSKGTVTAGGTAYVWGPVFQVEGTAVAEIRCYSDVVANNGASPTKPSGSTFNLNTPALTINDSNWNKEPPSILSDGDTVYSCTALVSGSPKTTSVAVSWENPTIFARKTDGAAGAAGSNSKTVHLTVDDYSIVYLADGSTPSPSGNMTLTASSQNLTNGYFKFTGDGITDETSFTDGSGANADTFTFAIPSSHFANPKSLRVGVSEGDQTEVAFDTITITAVKPGAAGVDGMSFILTNASHTFPASVAGAVSSYSSSGTIIEVYEGATALLYDASSTAAGYWKTAEAVTNITLGSKTDSGAYLTVADHSGVASGTDTSEIVYTISGKRADGAAFSTTAKQTFTKSKEGEEGQGTKYASLYALNDSAIGTTTAGTFANPAASAESGWTISPPSLASNNDIIYVTTRTFTSDGESPQTSSWTTPVIHSRRTDGAAGASGTDAYTVRLSATKYAIAYNIDGGESDSLTFTAAPQGIQGTATYKFEVDGTQKQAASTTATYAMADGDEPASGNAKVVKVTMYDNTVEKATDSVSVYGIQSGSDAITIIMTNETHALPTNSAGTVTYDNSGTDIKVFRGSTQLNYHASNASTFSVAASASNITAGAASTISSNIRRYAVHSSITAAIAAITYTITVRNALGTATTFTKLQTLNKTVDGAPGAPGDQGKQIAEIDLYYPLATGSYVLPSSAPTSGTYNFGTGVVAATITSGWTQTKPAIEAGKVSAASKALATEATAEGGVSGALSWSTPVLYGGGPPILDYIFIYASSAPDAPADTNYPALPDDWTTSIPTNPNDGKKLYSSKGLAKFGGSFPNFTFKYDWETPVVHTQTWSDVSGTTDAPADNSTVGATVGTNFYKTGTTTNYVTNEFQNANITLNAAGYLNNIGTTQKVSNSIISLSSAGVLSGAAAGTQAITKAGAGIPTMFRQNDPPTALAAGDIWIDTNDSNKMYRSSAAGTGSWVASTVQGMDAIGEGTRKGYADRAGTAIDSSNRVTGSLYDGTNTRTPANINDSYVRATTAIDSSNRVTGSLYDGTNTRTPANINDSYVRATTAIDSSNRVTGSLYDGTNTRTPANINDSYVRATTGLSATGYVELEVPTTKGGTGETNTNKFLNSGISVAQGASGVFTLTKGDGTTDTTTISKTLLGLSYTDGADVTSANTSADTTLVNGTAAATVKGGAVKANLGLSATGYVELAVPETKGGTGLDSNATLLNSAISLSSAGVLSGAATGTQQITKLGVGIPTVFRQPGIPTSIIAGDLWVDTNDNFKTYIAEIVGANEIKAGEWVLQGPGKDITALTVGTLTTGSGGTGATNLNALDNARVQMNTDGSLNYAAGGSGSVSKAGLELDYTDGATVGATVGTNFYKTGTTTNYVTNEFQNANITLNAAGHLNNIGTTQKVSNNVITVSSAGVLTGTGTADIKVNNAKTEWTELQDVSNNKPADNATVGAIAGTNLKAANGTTTLGDNDVKNSALDVAISGTAIKLKIGSTETSTVSATQGLVGLSGVADNATVGAIAGTNLKAANGTTTLGDDDVKNSALDVAISGTAIKLKIGSTETSTVTATQGLVGLSGVEDNATVGATWDTNITSQPADADILNSGITTSLNADVIIATWVSDDSTNYTPLVSLPAVVNGLTVPGTGNIDVTLRAINNGVVSTVTWRWTLSNGFLVDDSISGDWEGTHTGWTNATVGGDDRNATVVLTYDSKTITLRASAINITISGGGK